ncbi:MAG: S41 family peptidase [Lachnospiraceae bacterium]|nr:S41 family peptidase [Lachnospiraceae bacterium]
MDFEEKKEQSSATEYFEADVLGEKSSAQAPVSTGSRKKKAEGSFGQGLFLGVLLTLLIVLLVVLGVKLGKVLTTQKQDSYRLDVTAGSAIDYDLVQKLQSLEQIIHRYYYKDDLTAEQLSDGIYKGLLDSLGDPYSEYYTPEELADLIESTEGVYYGIGAYVSLDTDRNLPKISSVIEGTPAEEAGLRDNDILYKVDGTSTYGLSLNETVALIKGEEFTDVLLTIIRDGKEMEVTVTRRKVETPTVKHEMLEDGMGFLQIVEFDDVTVSQFRDAMTDLRAQEMKGLILDLRANPGGSLDAVVDIAEMLLPEGMIVYTEDKYGNRREYTCDGSQQLEMPLVVLIDMNSASASEILAGAIKDYGIGTLVGTTSFGKGIVQQILPFSDGSAIKVTVSSYYTPKGYNIHGIGIKPDVEIAFDGETYYSNEEHYDNQLEKAKEVLKDKMK